MTEIFLHGSFNSLQAFRKEPYQKILEIQAHYNRITFFPKALPALENRADWRVLTSPH